jgi:hypothetical protein
MPGAEVLRFLMCCVRGRANVIVSGGAGTGKYLAEHMYLLTGRWRCELGVVAARFDLEGTQPALCDELVHALTGDTDQLGGDRWEGSDSS